MKYHKLKHGFNATCDYECYRLQARGGWGIKAVRVSKSDSIIDPMGRSVELIGFIERELARMVLDLDAAGLL